MGNATRAIVDLDAITGNVAATRERVGPGVAVCAAVKANGYGHGAVPVARACVRGGASMLAAAIPAEAIELRQAFPDARIMMFGGLIESDVEELVRERIELTLSNGAQLAEAASVGKRLGVRPAVHVNVDTGMGRIGVHRDEAAGFVVSVAGTADVELASVYSHFPASDEGDRSFAREQIDEFKRIVADARAGGAEIPCAHLANSGAILDLPESYLDMVRPGMMLYGCYPSPEASHAVPIRPAMKLVSRLALVRDIPKGWTVSYGRTYTAPRDIRVGVAPAGYADGLSRKLSNAGNMIVRGKAVPIIGRVCMDLTMLDLTDLPEAKVGDEVVIYSDRREDPNSVENVAKLVGTIPNEIVCAVSARVERVYRGASGD